MDHITTEELERRQREKNSAKKTNSAKSNVQLITQLPFRTHSSDVTTEQTGGQHSTLPSTIRNCETFRYSTIPFNTHFLATIPKI